jgi:hypothetical protein
MLKLADTYSKPCNPVNMIASTTVKTKPNIASDLLPAVIA